MKAQRLSNRPKQIYSKHELTIIISLSISIGYGRLYHRISMTIEFSVTIRCAPIVISERVTSGPDQTELYRSMIRTDNTHNFMSLTRDTLYSPYIHKLSTPALNIPRRVLLRELLSRLKYPFRNHLSNVPDLF